MKLRFACILFLCAAGVVPGYTQIKTSFLIQSSLDDEKIDISVNKSVYFPGDTVLLVISRKDSIRSALITPILPIPGTNLRMIGRQTYSAVISQSVTPGHYPISLRVTDGEGRRYRYETETIVSVEEYQDVEHLHTFVSIIPVAGGSSIRTAVTIEPEQVQKLQVRFTRDSIRTNMGPQFLRIRTSILQRDDIVASSYERRVVTFRSHGNKEKDHSVFVQYRTAYGAYANIRPEELEQVLVPVDSLPAWAILGIHIEPDYTIKIGAVDRSNSLTQYYRVRGPTIELGFSLAVPKVLFDTREDDPIEYGNTSAMIRCYFIDAQTGNRFPISAGIGMFGINSPVDVGPGRGGFAWSMFLDLAEMVRIMNIGFTKKVNIGLEVDPFFSIQRKMRLLVVAQAGFSF